MARYDRSELRGKSLEPNCYKAKISKHEFGPDDKRLFCHGLMDMSTGDLIEQCKECGAHVNNAFKEDKKDEQGQCKPKSL